ncbi:MAG: nitroreductase family protein [Alphaproteobacteria bacterium]|nr:nitroreductase family protein [Alphaproteobacteria bacterium]
MASYEPVPLPDFVELPLADMRRNAQEFYEHVRKRHTIRAFSPRPVPRDIIEVCLLAAGTAPNGANLQPWHFVAVSDSGLKRKIREGAEEEERMFYSGRAGQEWLDALKPIGTDANKSFLEVAPWLIGIFGQRKSPDSGGRIRKNYYVPESVGIATGILLTALHRAGLATLTHTPSPMTFLNKLMSRPETEKPYVLLVVGYPAKEATVPKHALRKKPLEEISTFI